MAKINFIEFSTCDDTKNSSAQINSDKIILVLFLVFLAAIMSYLYIINAPLHDAYIKGYNAGLTGTDTKYNNCKSFENTWMSIHGFFYSPFSILFEIVGCGHFSKLISLTPGSDIDNAHAYAVGYRYGYEYGISQRSLNDLNNKIIDNITIGSI
jgi:hypothetical protein